MNLVTQEYSRHRLIHLDEISSYRNISDDGPPSPREPPAMMVMQALALATPSSSDFLSTSMQLSSLYRG